MSLDIWNISEQFLKRFEVYSYFGKTPNLFHVALSFRRYDFLMRQKDSNFSTSAPNKLHTLLTAVFHPLPKPDFSMILYNQPIWYAAPYH